MRKIIVIAALAVISLASCDKGEKVVTREAIVTVCGGKGEKCTLNLDDNTVLVPENVTTNPYGNECRALTIYNDKGGTNPVGTDSREYRKVELIRIDSVLTKSLAPNLGKEQNDEVYGTDPIELYNSWLTVVEDGYVTLHFLGMWGYPGTTHSINLVKDTDPKDPFHFELRHNYNGDIPTGGLFRKGIAAFSIKEIMSKYPQGSYKVTLTYQGHDAVKDVVFNYTPGTSATIGSVNDTELSADTLYR